MSSKPKFDPSRLTSLLERGTEEGRGMLGTERAPVPALASVPAPVVVEAPSATPESVTALPPAPTRRTRRTATPAAEPEVEGTKRPITVRLTEEVLHALLRHQTEVRCKPGARLGDTTIGGVIDTLLRGPLGLS